MQRSERKEIEQDWTKKTPIPPQMLKGFGVSV